MMQKPGDRRLSNRDLFLPEPVFEFGQRDVRLLSYQLPHQVLMRRQREIFVAAEFGRLDAARLPVKLEEADDRADADAALLRSFRDGGPALNRPNHSPTQILRIRLRHPCWPPPSTHLESCSRRYGNPRFSLLVKRSSRPSFLMHRKQRHLRLADRPADYNRLGISPVEVAEFEDGQRIGTEKGRYEWWYFDAHLDDGATVVVVFYTKPNVSPNGPLAPRITINLTLPDGRTFVKFLDTKAELFSASKSGCDVRIGSNRFVGDLNRYHITATKIGRAS